MRRIPFALFILLISLACSLPSGSVADPTATPAPSPTEAPAEPTVPPMDDDGIAFRDDVLAALTVPRDYASLTQYMGTEFSIAGWQAGGSLATRDEAVTRLQNDLLLPGNTFTYALQMDIASLIGQPPEQFFGPDVVDTVFSTGWGADGQGEAILLFEQTPEGDIVWGGVLVAPQGFNQEEAAPPPTEFTTLDGIRDAVAQALAGARDYQSLTRFMGNEFSISGWQAGGSTATPQEAVNRLQNDLLLPESVFTYELGTNLEPLIGQPPEQFFPNAAGFLYSPQGWGADGQGEAILIFGEAADGTFIWRGVLIAPSGFTESAPPPPAEGPFTTLDSIQQAVTQALAGARDYQNLTQYMGTEFSISGWQAGGSVATPQEAVTRLQNDLLLPNSTFTYELGFNVEPLIGAPPEQFFGPDTAGVVYSPQGWGADGQGEAILIFEETGDGTFIWSGVLVAPSGF